MTYTDVYPDLYPAGVGTLAVINQWSLADTGGYGPVQVSVSNTAGNALVAYLAASSDNVSGYVPRMSISDDVHNWWIYAGTSLSSAAGAVRRVDIWVCPNAKAASHVSVAASMVYAGLTGSICEVTGFPQYAQVDFTLASSNLASSLSVSGTQPGVSDFYLACLLTAGPSISSLSKPASMSFLTPVSSGGGSGDMSGLTIYPEFDATPNAAGAVSLSWSWTTNTNAAVVVVGFSAIPPPPALQPNSNWPGLLVEAAFGFRPASTDGSMPSWTDITPRIIDEDGQQGLKASRGREFELTQPEAGELDLPIDNRDGALNPSNTGSPFYPNVLPEVPVRVSALWQGRQYGIAYSYANSWPQDFPDPQWGVTSFKGSDAIGIASQGQMVSAYAGQVLADLAYNYYPMGEFYNNPHGSLFSNLSRTNLKPMVGYSPGGFTNSQVLQTGQTLGMAGDTATGIGMQGFAVSGFNSFEGGPGAFVRDNGLPPLAGGVSLEFWTNNIPGSGSASTCVLLTALGKPANYLPVTSTTVNGARLQVSVTNIGGGNIQWTTALYDPTGVSLIFAQGNTPSSAGLNHVVVTVSKSGTTWTVVTFVNAVQVTSGTGTTTLLLDWSTLAGGPVIPTGGQALTNNYVIGQMATYSWLLPFARMRAHYNTGTTADSGDTVSARLGKLFAWSGLGLPFGAARIFGTGPSIGNADQIAGAALGDNIYNLSVDEGGMYYCPATALGEVWYTPRASLYNKPPKYTFGDNGTTEIPYLTDSGFDFSDTYLNNIVSSQRTISQTQQFITGSSGAFQGTFNNYGADAVVADLPSEAEFFPRGPLQQDIETTSDQDAYDRANWTLAKFKQPHLRANQIALVPSTNPSIWPVALGIEQGDIVTVNRRQLGAALLSVTCIVQKVEHAVGPDNWVTTLSLAPYFPENAVIQLDNSSFNELGDGVLGW